MSSVISLGNFNSAPCPYLLISSQQKPQTHFFSPHVFCWSEDLFIYDLQDTYSYWLYKAQQQDLDLHSYLQNEIPKYFGSSAQALLCSHPWQGLLLLENPDLLPDNLHFLDLSTEFAKNLLKKVSWTEWVKTLKKVFDFLPQQNIPPQTHPHLRRLEKTMEHLGYWGPYQFPQTDFSQWQKRYGLWAGHAWKWTFNNTEAGDLPLFQQFSDLSHFPWVEEPFEEAPSLKRHLDFPLINWESIEPLLAMDLNSLCGQFSPAKKVTLLNWTLHLYDGQEIPLTIIFRNPHSLHKEKPEQKTALCQSYFSFQGYMNRWQQHCKESQLAESLAIVGWDILVRQTHEETLSSLHLLSSHGSSQEAKIQELENKLPFHIEAYKINPNFHWKSSYSKRSLQQKLSPRHLLWKQAARLRPLFLFPKKKALENSKPLSLLEKIGAPWWETEDLDNYENLGHLALSETRELHWAFLENNIWYSYGSFD